MFKNQLRRQYFSFSQGQKQGVTVIIARSCHGNVHGFVALEKPKSFR